MDPNFLNSMDFELQANFDDVAIPTLGWEGDDTLGPWAECLFGQCTRPNSASGLPSHSAASEIQIQSPRSENDDFKHLGQLSSLVAHTVQLSPESMVQDGSTAAGTPNLLSPMREPSCALDQKNLKRNIDNHLGRFPARGNENGRRKRQRYSNARRQDVALVRKVNACFRCRSGKVPVSLRSPS